jgi:hypothetical protein
MASIPNVTVEVAFDGGPFSTSYTWTDISDYVEGFKAHRGRNNELDRIEAGTISLTLDNSDGRFTPGKQKLGGNILSGFSGQYVWDLSGRADNTVMSSISIGQVDDDQKPRVMSRTVYTDGAPVSCYFAVKWLDAGGATLRFVIGTRFVADSSPAVYTHTEAPPAGVATAVLYIYADTYPQGNTPSLTAYGEKAEWFKTQPYFPNVVPRRRVRVRTANLTPKDVSTGGDITGGSSLFSASHISGQSKSYITSVSKSGQGSIRFDTANNGTADWASSIYCGYSSGGAPKGLARVTPGESYSTGTAVRLGLVSRDVNLKTRIRWYDTNLSLINTSSGGPSTVLKGDRYNMALNPSLETDLTNISAYGSGITRARVTTEFYKGSASMEHTWTTDAVQAGSTWILSEAVSGTGKTIRFRFALKIPATGLSNFQLAFRNSSGTVKLTNQAMPGTTGAWTEVETSYTLAAGETIDRVGFSFLGALNTKMWADAMMCQVTSATLPAYADGSMSGYHWAGNANASATVADSWSPAWAQVSVLNQTAPANAAWAGIEVGTSGGDSNAYVLLDEVQLEDSATLSAWNPGGSIFHGYIEKWPVTADGLTSSVEVSAVDGFSVFGNTNLRRPLQAEILSTGPLGYWTLGDPVGSTRLENLADDTKPAKLVASKYGGGTPLLGATSLITRDDTTSYSLANVATNQGTVVDICDGGTRNYVLGTDFSVAFWTDPVRPSAGTWVTLFAGWSDTGAEFMTIRMDSGGFVQVNTTFTDGTQTSFTSSTALSSGTPHFIMVHVESGTTRLYYDGDLRASYAGSPPSNLDIRDLRWASLGGRQAGTVFSEYSNGRHGHIAIWDRRLSWAEQNEIWNIGTGPEVTESENARISRLAQYSGFTGETALDAGMSTLQGPSWDTGASALEELQGAAQDASGYIFMDGDGRLTYHNRARRQSATVRFELGDTVGLPWEPGLQFEMDDDRIINEVTYKRPNGIEGVLKDQASIDAYGRKSTSIELGVTSDSAVQDASYTLLNIYADPMVRCDSVTLKCSATPALFLPVLSVEVGDRITLTDLPTAAPDSELDYYVEAIDTEVSSDGGTLDWITTLSLSPADGSDVWILEDSTLGRLDRTTVLAY